MEEHDVAMNQERSALAAAGRGNSMTTDSDSTTTNLLDETLTLAHASKRVDEIADLQSRLQAAEEERDAIQAKVAGWHDKLTYPQLHLLEALQSRERWRELATEATDTLKLVRDRLPRNPPPQGYTVAVQSAVGQVLAKYDALQQEEDAG